MPVSELGRIESLIRRDGVEGAIERVRRTMRIYRRAVLDKRALAALDMVPASLATHALTIGAIGGLTIGMMTRVARGHTGRLLQASKIEIASYALIQFAAAVRVFLPLIAPKFYLSAIVISGALWSSAFLLFAILFWPILSRPGIDCRDG